MDHVGGLEGYLAIGPGGFPGAPDAKGKFDYRPQGRITGIVIEYSDAVMYSIAFKSKTDDDDSVSLSPKFGRSPPKSKTYMASFSTPGEYITGMEITLANNYIQYVWISTNVKTYSPFGRTTKKRISMAKSGMHAVGFFGNDNGSYLRAIGVYFKANTSYFVQDNTGGLDEYFAVGPAGFPIDSGNFDYRPQGKITGIVIEYSNQKSMYNISFQSRTDDGSVSYSPKFGSSPNIEWGAHTYKAFFTPNEYITGIEIEKVNNYIMNVWIHTNVKTYSSAPTPTEETISITQAGMHAVGFFGNGVYGDVLRAIGVYFKPNSTNSTQNNKVVKPWTYLPEGLLTNILIKYGDVINSLVFESKTSDGAVTSSDRFGGPGGTSAVVPIGLGEHLTGIDLMIEEKSGQKVTNLLTIHTNLKTYGPFGKAEGSQIKIPIKEGSIIGFSGRAGIYLNTSSVFEVVQPKDDDTTVKPDPVIVITDPTIVKPVGPDFAVDNILLDISIDLELS